jgi:cell division septation protein DedD
MTDEGLHEVQLNGKQLVFLFMVGTVIAVVIFLCGVLVGRGLRPAASAIDVATADSTSTIDPTQSGAPPTSAPTPSSDGTPVSAQEQLTYAERLGSASSALDEPREPARPVAEPRAPVRPPPAEPARSPAAAPAATQAPAIVAAKQPTVPAALPEPAGTGFVVQVMAVNVRGEADGVARRLLAKGYPAFVTTNGASPNLSYRVRVGKYDTLREADAISARLKKEEQFEPWVTR